MDQTHIVIPASKDAQVGGQERSRKHYSLLFLLKRIHVGRLLLFICSLALFIFAISLMKDGARAISPFIREVLSVHHPLNSLGLDGCLLIW